MTALPPADAPDALLLIAPGCTHCPSVLAALADQLKAGRLGRLEVVNIAARPQAALALGVRSVPWMRIGSLELEGLQSPAELARWVSLAGSPEGYARYLANLLEVGQLERATGWVGNDPLRSAALVGLLASLQTPMAVRIGVGAVLEELASRGAADAAAGPLARLLESDSAQVRADACHYLGLTADPRCGGWIRPLLQDPDGEVREIARETLEELGMA
jgi:hypothetical protein